MSGFGAFVHFDARPIDPAALDAFARSLRFRAPDGERIACLDHVGLVVAQMRIDGDPPAAAAPLCLDQRWWIVGDLRLYARDELVRTLRGAGADASTTQPDLWLVLLAHKAWGTSCVTRFNGTFSFALWDAHDRRLTCACDHFGERPVFYAIDHAGIRVSNTLSSLREALAETELNDEFLADFLALDVSLVPDATAFRRIKRLPPAHTLSIDAGGEARISRYWSLPVSRPDLTLTPAETREQFRTLLRDAVLDRLPHGPASIWLSGGLDSTAIAALAAKSGRSQLTCFTMGLADETIDPEPLLARRVATALGVAHCFHGQDHYRLFEDWDGRVPHMPEPWHDPFLGARLRSMQDSTRHGRIAISGDGGDEVLCPEFGIQLVNRVPAWRLVTDVVRHVHRYRRLPPMGIRKTLGRWHRGLADTPRRPPAWLSPDLVRTWNVEQRMADHHWGGHEPFPLGLRPRGATRINRAVQITRDSDDPGTIGVALETRKPFLDLRLVDFLFSVPPLYWCSGKALLREAMADELPSEILRRPKTGVATSVFATKVMQERAGVWERFTPSPLLGRYVDLSELEELRSETSLDDAWRSLTPLSFNYWLHTLER